MDFLVGLFFTFGFVVGSTLLVAGSYIRKAHSLFGWLFTTVSIVLVFSAAYFSVPAGADWAYPFAMLMTGIALTIDAIVAACRD